MIQDDKPDSDLPQDQKSQNELKQFKMNWLAIGHGIYQEKSYQYVYRPFIKQSTSPNAPKATDGVQIVPIIEYTAHKQIVFNASFRPAVGKFIIQFPAGIAEGQNMFDNAKRELLEQTGLVPYKFVQMPHPVIYADPIKGNQSGIYFIALIDGLKQESFVPIQREKEENIRCYSMKYTEDICLCQKLENFALQNGYIFDAKTWLVCMGVDLAKNLKSWNLQI